MKSVLKNLVRNEFVRDEEGAGTVFALSMGVCCIVIGGLAVDASNAWQMQQRLQATADVAAHAGLMALVQPDPLGQETPESAAIEMASMNMPVGRFGDVLVAADVEIGSWDRATRTMNTGAAVADAVRVTTRLDGNASTAVPTFLLRLAGFTQWTISASAVFQRDYPDCFNDGLIAGGVVDLTSNNAFRNNFCIHGVQGVVLRSNNEFEEGVRITMPDARIKADGGLFDPKGNNNVGMWEALGESALTPLLSSEAAINEMIANYANPNWAGLPAYITNPVVNVVSIGQGGGGGGGGGGNNGGGGGNNGGGGGNNGGGGGGNNGGGGGGNNGGGNNNGGDADAGAAPLGLMPNAINLVTCNGGNNTLNFGSNDVVENLVLVTNCAIHFGSNMSVQNATMITSDTGNMSMRGAAGLSLGADDNCAPGGGATLVTMGSAHFAAQMNFFGSQIIANQDVMMAAQVGGIEGVSVQAGGDITITANNTMGLCGGGVDHAEHQYVFRMVN